MLCSTCNLEYPDYLNFCRRCGKPLVHSTAETAIESHCCTRCGARVVRGENFCQQCGNRLNMRTQETVIGACHHCGTSWRSGWLFCKNCGLDRDHALMPRVSTPAGPGSPRFEVIAELEEILKLDKVYCPKCGVEAKPYSKFCEKCGMMLDQAEDLETPSGELATQTGNPDDVEASTPTILNEDEADLAAVTIEEEPAPELRNLRTRPDKTAPVTVDSPSRRRTLQIEESSQTNELTDELKMDEERAPTIAMEMPSEPEEKSQPTVRTYAAVPPVKPEDQRKRTNRAAFQTLSILAIILLLMVAAYLWWVSQRARTTIEQTAEAPAPGQTTPPKSNQQIAGQPEAPKGMVYIPGGRFLMGRDDGDEYERPSFSATVNPFFIDRTEVTNEDYQIFVNSTGHRTPSNWRDGRLPERQEKFPVVNVSWEDAGSYAQWANKRLPTEEEWEFAGRGSDGRKYPWGGIWIPGNANAAGQPGALREVGSYPAGASPFGVLDLSGNVWEWTASDLTSYTNKNIKLAEGKVIRGGAYDVTSDRVTTTYRGVVPQDKYYDKTGFRCVRDLK